jgi:tripartite-type tricarboxylate transporter receptor subunit TctC
MKRRTLLATLAAPALAQAQPGAPLQPPASAGAPATGPGWPDRPLKLVVPFPPGGVADVLARPLAQALAAGLGQPVVVENRGGAAGTIGAAAVARAAPDGLTLLFGTANELAMTPPLHPDLPYDPRTGFAPITPVASFPNVLVVRPGSGLESLPALLAEAKRRPLSYASSGIGSTNHLSGALLAEQAGMALTHVPYSGGGPALNDVIAGHVDLFFATLPSVTGHVRGGQLKALLVTAERRSPALPEVPSAAEAGLPELLVSTWNGVLAPAGTPRPVVLRLHGNILSALEEPALRERYALVGAEPLTLAPEAFATLLARDLERWTAVIRRAGIRRE